MTSSDVPGDDLVPPDLVPPDLVLPDKVTIYEVAKQAGVSIATVSHALNRPGRVSAHTMGKVLEVVDQLGYVPKATAVSQARKGVGRIGVMAPFSTYDSYVTRLLGVLRACEDKNLDVVVLDHRSPASTTSPLLSTLPASGRLDGLIIMGLPLDDAMAKRLVQRNLSTVIVDSSHLSFNSVNVDDVAGGYLVGKHLTGTGRRTFAFVSEAQRSTDYISSGQLRLQGFMKALGESGLGDSDIRWVITSNDIAGGRATAEDLLALDSLPDAVFAHHDDLAAGLLAHFRSVGVQIPSDIAVIGYDASPLSEALDLTSVRQPFAETGLKAASMLQSLLDHDEGSVQAVNLIPELVVRATS